MWAATSASVPRSAARLWISSGSVSRVVEFALAGGVVGVLEARVPHHLAAHVFAEDNVAVGERGISQQRREALTLERVRRLHAAGVVEERHVIEGTHQRCTPRPTSHLRPADNERHVRHRLVVEALVRQAVIAERVPVVGGIDDERFVKHAVGFQRGQYLADFLVD